MPFVHIRKPTLSYPRYHRYASIPFLPLEPHPELNNPNYKHSLEASTPETKMGPSWRSLGKILLLLSALLLLTLCNRQPSSPDLAWRNLCCGAALALALAGAAVLAGPLVPIGKERGSLWCVLPSPVSPAYKYYIPNVLLTS